MRRKQSLDISRLKSRSDAEACARLMASSEPWVTLGRSYEASLRIVGDSSREVYVARDENGPAGFLILCMTGAFVGYIQTVLVHPDRRGQGIGSRLVRFAEDRIFRDSPNIFMCVSSFNSDARANEPKPRPASWRKRRRAGKGSCMSQTFNGRHF